jgi:hypothetical protein
MGDFLVENIRLRGGVPARIMLPVLAKAGIRCLILPRVETRGYSMLNLFSGIIRVIRFGFAIRVIASVMSRYLTQGDLMMVYRECFTP